VRFCLLSLIGALTAGCTSIQMVPAAQAEMWVTTADESQKLAQQPLLAAGPVVGGLQQGGHYIVAGSGGFA